MKRYPKRATKLWRNRKRRIVWTGLTFNFGPPRTTVEHFHLAPTPAPTARAALIFVNSPGGTVEEFKRSVADIARGNAPLAFGGPIVTNAIDEAWSREVEEARVRFRNLALKPGAVHDLIASIGEEEMSGDDQDPDPRAQKMETL